ncbi:MAG: carbonic anhydrase, partial [Chlamydiota bacterium]
PKLQILNHDWYTLTSGGVMSVYKFKVLIVLCLITVQVVVAEDEPTTAFNREDDDPLELLIKGNQRFVENKSLCENMTQESREELAEDQSPIATLIVCSDSRVAPEQIFDQKMGKLFVIRLAGNVVDQFALASIEYGVSVLKTPLIIVMGHQNCGAVKEAFKLEEETYSANISSLLVEIYPSVKQVKDQNHLSETEQLKLATQYNVENSHRQAILRSPVIRDLVKEEKVKIVDAFFYIDTGKVEWGPFNSKTKPFWKN